MGLGVLVAVVGGALAGTFGGEELAIAFFFAGYGLMAFGVSGLAEAKGRDGGMYFWLALGLSFVVALLIVWMLPDKSTRRA
jgi:hypothetical protein